MPRNTIIQRISLFLRTGQLHLLFLEFIVVAVGLFFGFQLDRWYEQRQDTQKIEQYVHRLLADIDVDLSVLERVLDSANYRLRATDMLFDSIDDLTIPGKNPTEYMIAFEQSIYRYNLVTQNATYTELVNTGDMALLPVSIRNGLYEYYGDLAQKSQFNSMRDNVQQESYSRFSGMLLPHQIERGMKRDATVRFSIDEAMAAAKRFRSRQEAIDWIPRLRIVHITEIADSNSITLRAADLKSRLKQY
ncbi:MAG: hypothetical protein COA96_14235 [SAR86 cluster bacterium]|uniref:Uncharacterized protein n=1 Tax=SAR86 cluster bacterium TaxID=2030880 RepID=A0A2A5AT19_9GAMM|nr:MAG: hypothetical protein COA96_14235 [SAR86 cluster bacterium]